MEILFTTKFANLGKLKSMRNFLSNTDLKFVSSTIFSEILQQKRKIFLVVKIYTFFSKIEQFWKKPIFQEVYKNG